MSTVPKVPAQPVYNPADEEAKAKTEAKALSKKRQEEMTDTIKTTPLGVYGEDEKTKKKTLLGE